jgi:serine/threonine-protein kinase
MICPRCNTTTPDDAPRCPQCGVSFQGLDTNETIGPGGSTPAPASSASARKPSTAAGVLTPPPSSVTPGSGGISGSGSGSGSGGGSSGISWSRLQDLVPGSDFSARFRIEAMLGQGGMGMVFKAYDKELDRPVALKVLRPELTPDPAALQRFKQELLLATKVSHKNILRIHDLGEAGGVKFISMAFIEGEDLWHLLKREGKLPEERIVAIGKQLCGALEAAHAEGIIHRDLKPQNVLVDASGNIFVSDFGLAKSLEAGTAGMTRAGEYLGTPRYMSPEQVEGKPLDNRSDLYSLGLILYEMAAGEVPFKGESTLQVMFARVQSKPKNPKEVNPDIPAYLERVIMRCLEKDPAARYQHAREIAAELEGTPAPSGTQAPSGSRTFQITLPGAGSRPKLYIFGAVVAVLALLLAIPPVRHLIFRTSGGGSSSVSGIPPLAQGKYVAVLPFRVLGDPTALGYVAEGLGEAISAKLFQMKDVRVASSSAVEKVDAKEPLDKIARELGVNLILQGKVQGSSDRLSVIVNLEDVAGGKRLWSQEFSGVPKDLLTLEDQMYNGLLTAMELKPSGDELAKGAARPTENIEAYDLYLKGRNSMRGFQDPRNVEAAIKFYEDALKKDSGFALAYAGMADASLAMYKEKKDSFWSGRALAAAQQAQRLNEKLPEVHFALGSVYSATGKTSEAIAELKRALELAPNSDDGYRRLGSAYLSQGEKDPAVTAYKKAIEVNPYYWLNHNALGSAYLQFGENDKSLAAFKQVTELEPDNFAGYENMGNSLLRQGKYSDAIPLFQKSLSLQSDYSTYSNLGVAYFYLEQYGEAVKGFEKAVEMNPNEQIAWGNLADAYRWSGQKDKANTTYDKAIALAYKELQVNPRSASTLGYLASYYAKKGESAKALDFSRRARAIDPQDVYLVYQEALVQALAGRSNDALKSLREAFRRGYPAEEAVKEPELKNLRTNPEFAKLVKEFPAKPN